MIRYIRADRPGAAGGGAGREDAWTEASSSTAASPDARDLDAAVAARLERRRIGAPSVGPRSGGAPPRYSSEIALAWPLIEELRELYPDVDLWLIRGDVCVCTLGAKDPAGDWDGTERNFEGATAAEAICRAYLALSG